MSDMSFFSCLFFLLQVTTDVKELGFRPIPEASNYASSSSWAAWHGMYLGFEILDICPAGDVKEFGFRPIPEDGNYASHFSGETGTPKADPGDGDQTPFSDSRPTDSSPDLIDLGQSETQGSQQDSKEAVSQAITDADAATKQDHHPHLRHRGHHEQAHQQQGMPVRCQSAL